MIHWFRKRKMTGGLVFGPPAWLPGRIENTFEPAQSIPARTVHLPATPPDTLDEPPHERRELAAFLEELGITQTSALLPSLADQLRNLGTAPIKSLVLSLLPTQPEFALPAALSHLALDDLQVGFSALQRVLRPQRSLLIFDRHDAFTWAAWKSFAKANAAERVGLLNRYPQAHPTILMRSLFGKRLPVGALPSRHQRLFLDPVTIWALGRWIRTRTPFAERPVQVFEQDTPTAPGTARLAMGRLGESIADFAARYGFHINDKQLLLNGMLSGADISPTTPITAATESLAIREPVAPESSTACIACGWCVDVCPTALTPVRLLELAQRIPTGQDTMQSPRINSGAAATALLRTKDARESLHCIGCGLCSYVCPTRLPLTQETLRLRARVEAAAGPAPHKAVTESAP